MIDSPQAAMAILVKCMAGKSGQSYKLRNLLYSLWNGQASASLIEVRGLDSELRLAFCIVVLQFGSGIEYDGISDPIKKAGLFDWFCEEHNEALADFLSRRAA